MVTGVSAQQTRLLTADKHNEYGLIYTLPETALEIEVTALRTVNKTGPYYQYAKRYIGTDKVIKEDSESWEITSVDVRPYGVGDDTNRYLMQLKPGSTTYICVSEDGMIRSINKEISESTKASAKEEKRTGREAKKNNVDLKEYLEYVNDDFLISQSSAKQAQMLAENLMEVRESKVSLTRGTAETMPTDGKQLELMLNSLAHQEVAMTAAFCGVTTTETVKRRYTYLPEDNGRTILFRMSDFSGFTDSDDYSGDPVYITVKITKEGELPLDIKGEEKKVPKDAVMYTIPGRALITISATGQKLFEQEMDFAQFGVKFGLSPTLFSSKKDKSYAVFNATTGALEEVGDVGTEQ